MLGFFNFVFQQIIGAYSEQFGKTQHFFEVWNRLRSLSF